MFEPCPTCGGSGSWCATCEGRGRVVSESVIEAVAEALYVADGGKPGIWNNIGPELRTLPPVKEAIVSVVPLSATESEESQQEAR